MLKFNISIKGDWGDFFKEINERKIGIYFPKFKKKDIILEAYKI